MKKIKISNDELQKFCGYYFCGEGNYLRKIFIKDNTLYWFRDKDSITKLTFISKNSFKFGETKDIITFTFPKKNQEKIKMELKGKGYKVSFDYFAKDYDEAKKNIQEENSDAVFNPDEELFALKHNNSIYKLRKSKQRLEEYDQPSISFIPLKDKLSFKTKSGIKLSKKSFTKLPDTEEDIAFASIRELANWLRTDQITSLELTKIYLDRLKKYGNGLNAVITITEELAISQAKKADLNFKNGIDKGLLQGIPYGLKDIIDTKNIVTTWGLDYYKKNRIPKKDATIVKKFNSAGAVLVAKLALGRCAGGLSCHIGETKNAWNKEENASGSSSGSGVTVSAGLVSFAIGTETWGSIEGPSEKNGVVGIRPSYGRVSRKGVLNTCFTMDKIGPMTRYVEDSVIVLNILNGYDKQDLGSSKISFNYDDSINLSDIKIGLNLDWIKEEENDHIIEFEKMLKEIESNFNFQKYQKLDFEYNWISAILGVEYSASLDDLSAEESKFLKIANDITALSRIGHNRSFSAVEYLHIQQHRLRLMKQAQSMFKKIDCLIIPGDTDYINGVFNLTGHPSISIPIGIDKKGMPHAIVLVGKNVRRSNNF